MLISELHVGQQVILPNRRTAEVTRLGRCYWPGCRYGDDCVEVRVLGKVSTMNYRAGQLEPLEVVA